MSRNRAEYKAASRQLEKELDLEWRRAEKEKDKPTTCVLGHLRWREVESQS
jgi:hypothetical protein